MVDIFTSASVVRCLLPAAERRGRLKTVRDSRVAGAWPTIAGEPIHACCGFIEGTVDGALASRL